LQDLTVAFKEKKLKEEMDKLAQELKKDVSIPGFRKGKVPVHMIKERFGPQLRSESLQKLIQEKIVDIIQKYEPFVYGPPVVKNFKEEDEEVRLEVSLDIPPEIDLDLSAIDIENTKEEKIDVSTELEKLREINSELKSVDRKIEKGDIVFLDVKNEKEVIPNYSYEIGDDFFSEKLKGIKIEQKNEEIEIELPEDFQLKGFEDNVKSVKVKIVEIKEKVKPSLDDEFAKDLGFANLNELKENLMDNLKKESEKESENDLKDQLVKKALELADDFEASPSLVELISRRGLNEEEAADNARRTELLDSIALKEKMKVEEEELDEWMEKIADSDDESFENLGEEAIRFVKQLILRKKALDFLFAKAKGEDSNA